MLEQTLLFLMTLTVPLGSSHALRPPSTFECLRGNRTTEAPHAPGACEAQRRR